MAFKKRHDDARRKLNLLQQAPQEVEFDTYRSTLKNQSIVNEIEAQFKKFKPVTYDVDKQIKAIEAFETQAIKSAEETKGKVDAELKSLDATLKNIEGARPFEDLTVVSRSIFSCEMKDWDFLQMLIFWRFTFPGRDCGCKAGYWCANWAVGVKWQMDATWLQGTRDFYDSRSQVSILHS